MAPVGSRGFWLPDDVLGSQSSEIYELSQLPSFIYLYFPGGVIYVSCSLLLTALTDGL